MSRYPFLNGYVDDLTTQEVLDWIAEQVPLRTSTCVFEMNVDVMIKMEKDEELRSVSPLAGLSLIDGKPLIWVARGKGIQKAEKISGSDLMPKVCAMAAQKGYSVYILGGAEEVAQKAAENLRAECPGLKIAGCYSPPFGFEKSEAEEEIIRQKLAEADPDIVFLCLSCPKQEKWWLRNRDKIRVGVCLCAGASVDFAAGNVKRAPRWISNIGFEWLYRFFMEHKRLFKRYFVDDMQIFRLLFKYRHTDK